jgi:hypothetical protein
MNKRIFTQPTFLMATALFLVFISWVMWLIPDTNYGSLSHLLYNPVVGFFLYGFGAVVALANLRHIPLSSLMGKIFLGIGTALALFGIGDIVWGYYIIILHVDLPYPSLADLFYILYDGAVIYTACIFLSAAGGRIQRSHIIETCIIGIISAIALLGYLVRPDISAGWNNPQTFFNIAYPLFDVLLLSVSYVSFRTLGGTLRTGTLLLSTAMIIETIADTVFSVTTASGTYVNASWCDLLFATSAYLLTVVAIITSRTASSQSTS